MVYSRGRSHVHPLLVLHVRRAGTNGQRIGYSISKKVGAAVVRNRLKRRLRELTRSNLDHWRQGVDLVFVVRTIARDASSRDLQEAVTDLINRAGLCINEERKT